MNVELRRQALKEERRLLLIELKALEKKGLSQRANPTLQWTVAFRANRARQCSLCINKVLERRRSRLGDGLICLACFSIQMNVYGSIRELQRSKRMAMVQKKTKRAGNMAVTV